MGAHSTVPPLPVLRTLVGCHDGLLVYPLHHHLASLVSISHPDEDLCTKYLLIRILDFKAELPHGHGFLPLSLVVAP